MKIGGKPYRTIWPDAEGTSFSVRDVGSLNGTYVNRQRIDASALATGDEVQIGKFRLVVMLGEAE